MPPVVAVPPFWRIAAAACPVQPGQIQLLCEPGAGWGTGEHPTTQMCLQAIAAMAPRDRPWRMLDFGAGSGLLSIAAAKLGALVHAVELDPHGLAHTLQNARANEVADRITASECLDPDGGPFDLVAANILRSVLVRSAGSLCALLAPGGAMALCGLVSTDVPQVHALYSSLLGGRRAHVHESGEWRAVCFWPVAPAKPALPA